MTDHRITSHPILETVKGEMIDFTFNGKPIPPFFLTDFAGGPEANDFWTCGMGSRIAAVSVPGLFDW